ncbi:MAG: hypothetical protein ACPGVB_03380 [Chitinophagales bacterium]
MNPSNLKTLTNLAVKEAAEYLMTLNNETTTLEVKNRLRSQGYSAAQRQVSQGMDYLYSQNRNTWGYRQPDKYKIYHLHVDTTNTINLYLEKDDLFWAIAASGKAFTIETGKVGETGVFEEKSYETNRKMTLIAHTFLELQREKSFVEAVDKRLSLKVRQQFERFANQKMTGCKMGFFEAEKLVKQRATFEVNGQEMEGHLLLTKSAGYTFSWDLPKDLDAVRLVLASQKWDALKWGFRDAKLLGEKIKEAEAYNSNGVELKDGRYTILEKQTAMDTQAILVNNENLYQIECFFEGGERAVLSKFQMDLETEILPLVKEWMG